MATIRVLSPHVANLIAAGEVVERPASVVKELLENSIDAGANRITVEVQSGGIRMIRVSDNGCGMTAEDMPVALRRHATSKISTKEDLDGILTLGFRGEALAAIAAVSDMTILSKPKDEEMGTLLTATGGEVTDLCRVGCADGTTVTIENLFQKIPARRKFLKRDFTEAQAVVAIAERVALSRPDISFTVITDGTVRFQTVGDGDTRNVLYALYGADFAKRLLPIYGNTNGITVSGFIGRSDAARKNRNYQHTFLNGRYVKSKTVMAALEQAYTSYIAPERFPVAALYLSLDAGSVDVNVHPSKLEVKFSDERVIFESVYYAVRSALESASYRTEISLENEKSKDLSAWETAHQGSDRKAARGETLLRSFAERETDVKKRQLTIETVAGETRTVPPYLKNEAKTPSAPERATLTPEESMTILEAYKEKGREEETEKARLAALYGAVPTFFPSANRTAPASSVAAKIPSAEDSSPVRLIPQKEAEKLSATVAKEEKNSPPAEKLDAIPPYTYLGEAFRCYLFVETEEGLLLIDKHAAHERILFEELKAAVLSDGRIASQMLMLPVRATLSPEEHSAAEEYRDELTTVGFEYTLSAKGESELLAIPAQVDTDNALDLFLSMCNELSDGRGNPAVTAAIRKEKSLYQVACKAAIKGGRLYDERTLRWLIEKLLTLPNVTVCPHGRPVAVLMTKNDLDRRFDRIK